MCTSIFESVKASVMMPPPTTSTFPASTAAVIFAPLPIWGGVEGLRVSPWSLIKFFWSATYRGKNPMALLFCATLSVILLAELGVADPPQAATVTPRSSRQTSNDADRRIEKRIHFLSSLVEH